jgi:Heterokaryon incompatibility protein (HET)
MLCATCLAMFRNPREGRHTFQETFEDLVISTIAGCWVCTIISTKLQQEFEVLIEKGSDQVNHVQLVPPRSECSCPVFLSMQYFHEFLSIFEMRREHSLTNQHEGPLLGETLYYIFDNDYFIRSANIYVSLRKPAMSIKYLAQFHLIPRNAMSPFTFQHNMKYIPELPTTGSGEVLQLASRWLELCTRDHKQCSRERAANWAPPRLLDLTGQTPRLLLCEKERPKGPYVALSYCWGPHPTFLKLTSENLEQMCLQVPFHDLPLAFQHAVEVTKRLGVNYLWIDSLCILQSGEGSSEDWRKHLTEMRLVYSNCLFCIAVAHAPDPSTGCFTSRNPTLLNVPEIDLDGTKYVIVHANRFAERQQTPLATRAWVLQERMLSPRVLTFDKDQLFWDCSGVQNACESFPSGVPAYPKQKHKIQSELPGPFSLPASIGSDVQGYELWRHIVTDYCQRSLTYPSKDKFVALSGVAERMAALLRDFYAAGFFTRTLPWCLVWRTSRSAQTNVRPQSVEPYRAPSWSWAKLDGPVYFPTRREEDLTARSFPGDFAMLKDAHVTLIDNSNPFGQVGSATLTVLGRTAFARPKSTPADASGMWDPDFDPDVIWYIDGTPADTAIDVEDIQISMDGPMEAKEAAKGFHLCPIVAETFFGQSDPTDWSALILRRVQTSSYKVQTFTRVGVWVAPPKWLRLIKERRVREIMII